MKYISHLDILRTFNRALKRAELPVAYSQGFNPHPLVSFGLPLSVGVTSEAEYADIDFITDVDTKELISAINNVMPEGIKIVEAQLIDNKMPSIASSIYMADYKVTVFLKERLKSDFSDALSDFVSQDEIKIEKKKKKKVQEVNIAPDIHDIDIKENNEQVIIFNMKLSAGSRANLKPEFVIEALENYTEDFKVDFIKVHRKKLFLMVDLDMTK